MTKIQKLAMAAVSMAALAVSASSAQALVFATVTNANSAFYNEITGPFAGGGEWVANGNSIFSFTINGLPTNLTARLTFVNTGTTDGATATTSNGTTTYVEPGFTGAFIETYSGPTGTYGGVHLMQNVTQLLTGNITAGELIGYTHNGTNLPGLIEFSTDNYVSPYILGIPNGAIQLMLALGSPTTHWSISKYGNLATVGAKATGVFVSGVPEPATWGLMLVGFGLVGAAARRRRTVALA